MADKDHSRGLTRRLIQVALSASVLTGSGWGIYQYQSADGLSQVHAAADQTQNEQERASTQSEQKNQTASDELKDLLLKGKLKSINRQKARSAPVPNKLVADHLPNTGNRYDRYASEKPFVEGSSPQVRLHDNDVNNPFAAVPSVESATHRAKSSQTVKSDGRYATVIGLADVADATVATASPSPTTASVSTSANTMSAEPSVAAPAVPSPPEVTRGQEPGQEPGNPLRTEAPSPTAPPFPSEAQPLLKPSPARLAAGETRETLPLDKPAKSKPPAEDVHATLERARPLQTDTATLSNDRYRSVAEPKNFQVQPNTAPILAKSHQQLSAVSPPLKDVAPRPGSPTLTPGLTSRDGTGLPGERLLEGIQNPSITIEKLVPPEIQVGKKCTFAIRVQNTGRQVAQNVMIRDEVPKGTQLLGTAPRAMVNGSNLVWELGPMSAGEERIVEMELIPKEEGELGSVATVMFATQASAKTLSTRPELMLHISCSKPKVLVGEQQQLQIEISNPGSGDATGVLLLATLPAGLRHPAGPALELEVGTLPAGESRTFDLTLSTEQAGPIENVMTVRADANLQSQAACKFEIIAPQLHVNVKGPDKRFLERPATYQVSIENPGTAPAMNVQLVTHLPQGLKFVEANKMGEYRASTHSVHWSLPELPASQQGTVELVTLPVEAGAQTLQIETRSGQGLSDRTEKKIRVEGMAELKFDVTDTEDPIEIGGQSVYEIRLTNQGSKSAGNVQVVAKLPAGLRATSAEGETGHTIQGEWVEFAPLAQLEPKAIVFYRISVQGVQSGHQRIRVQLTSDEFVQPITKEESTRVYSEQ